MSIVRGISEADIAREDNVRVILTRDSVRQAVRRLVRLAATWEATNGFQGMLQQLQAHNVRVLEDVVAILDVGEQDAPIAFVNDFRITRADEDLVILHAAVAAELESYAEHSNTSRSINVLAWLLGNTVRIAREQIERAWARLANADSNWVTRNGPSEAAKILLGNLMAIAGGSRIAALKRLAKAAEPGPRFSSEVREIFESLENAAWSSSRYRSDLAGYAKRVLK